MKYYFVSFSLVEESASVGVSSKLVYADSESEAVEVAKCIMRNDLERGGPACGFVEGQDFNEVEAVERPMPKGSFV